MMFFFFIRFFNVVASVFFRIFQYFDDLMNGLRPKMAGVLQEAAKNGQKLAGRTSLENSTYSYLQ